MTRLPPLSADIERRYKQEMARLEQEKLREEEEETAVKQMTLDSDVALNKLDKVSRCIAL